MTPAVDDNSRATDVEPIVAFAEKCEQK